MRKRARASYVLRQLESVSHDFLKQQKYVKQLHWLYCNGRVLIVIALPDSHVVLSFGQNLFNLVRLAFELYAGCLVWNISSASTNFESCSSESKPTERKEYNKNGHCFCHICSSLWCNPHDSSRTN